MFFLSIVKQYMMQQIFKAIIIAPLLALLLIIVNPPVAKTNSAAPPAGGLSGDPTRTTCALIGCHFGTTGATYTFGPGDLTLNMGDTTTDLTPMQGQSYLPGKTYYIELRPNLGNGPTPRYGFQMTCLTAAGTMAGAFTIVNNRRNSAQTLLSRNYIGHNAANSNNDWIFQWTAPSADSGAVTFYFACNMANGDGTNGGDSIYTGTMVLNPESASGIFSVDNTFENLNIYPNPAIDFVNLSFENNAMSRANITLYSLTGKEIQSGVYHVQPSAVNNIRYQLPGSLSAGVYLLQLTSGNQRSVKRIFIL